MTLVAESEKQESQESCNPQRVHPSTDGINTQRQLGASLDISLARIQQRKKG
jgi:hypothetical protein